MTDCAVISLLYPARAIFCVLSFIEPGGGNAERLQHLPRGGGVGGARKDKRDPGFPRVSFRFARRQSLSLLYTAWRVWKVPGDKVDEHVSGVHLFGVDVGCGAVEVGNLYYQKGSKHLLNG